uniref:ATP synthase F0 subunit 6 n=1 Tax=Globodera ellingtonae TaxID=1517492 RepID=A0A2Z1SVJ8_9BILA|nr:ATP synthase F0 subunit 6 [Globodera ellingtonae]
MFFNNYDFFVFLFFVFFLVFFLVFFNSFFNFFYSEFFVNFFSFVGLKSVFVSTSGLVFFLVFLFFLCFFYFFCYFFDFFLFFIIFLGFVFYFAIFFNSLESKGLLEGLVVEGSFLLQFFLFWIELFSLVFRPLTLSLRLLVNLSFGHFFKVSVLILSLLSGWISGLFLLVLILDFLVILIQVYLFFILLVFYLGE